MLVLLVACWAALAAVAGRVSAQPGLLVGVTDDALKWTSKPAPLRDAMRDLGLGAIRYTQVWGPGESRVSAGDAQVLERALQSARGFRVVLSVYGAARAAPQDDAARGRYCSYVRSILQRFPQIHDVVIWNEVNSSMFWKPQFAADGSSLAPAAYERLLDACYAPLHTARPGLNMVASLAPRGNDDPRAPGSVAHAPKTFVVRMGDAYRASGRQLKLFESFAVNAYPRNSAERPWRRHVGAVDMSQGDYDRLLAGLRIAFEGTGQPLPGVGGMTVWYLEDGFQTAVDPARSGAYRGRENDRFALPPVAGGDAAHPSADSRAPDQATQLVDSIRRAYCQPGVGAYFNFLLVDEADLAGWQSGVLWADSTRKPSFEALARVVAEAKAGAVDCARLKGGPAS